MKLVLTFLSSIISIIVCGPLEFYQETPEVGIINGKTVQITKYPYMVAVIRAGQIWGSGVILNENWVLTTGYNAFAFEMLELRVGSNQWGIGGQSVKVANVTVHPKYSGSWQHNVAVFKTDQPLKLNKKVKAIALGTDQPTAGTVGYVAGWGEPGSGNKTSSAHLRAAENKVLGVKTCTKTYGDDYDASLFCSQVTEAGPCARDFGSPLVVKNHVYGLYGGGKGCSTWPLIYTNIPKLADWIKAAIQS